MLPDTGSLEPCRNRSLTPRVSLPHAVGNETSLTNPKCKQGNGLTPSLTLRIRVSSRHVPYYAYSFCSPCDMIL